VLAAALCVSAGYVAGAMLPPRGLSSLATTLWGVLLGTIVLAPLAAGLFVRDGVPEAGGKAWAAVVFLALVTSIVGYLGWYWALDRGGIARIATLQFLQPVSGFVLAAIVLGENVTVPIAIGSALIVGGILIAQRN
jgi:drug/metabolite transporter (DMT)-like permease